MLRQEVLGSLTVTGQARTDEPVDVGAVVSGAAADQQGPSLLVAGPHCTAHR